jgi:hypothetical protein
MNEKNTKFFVRFDPEMARRFESINRAIYLQNLIYWSDKGKRKDGYIYKKKEDIEKETMLTIYQQNQCRKYFEKKGILETKLIKANGAPTLHYKLKTEWQETY